MNPEVHSSLLCLNRRQALRTIVGGLGSMALGNPLASESASPLAHHRATAALITDLKQHGLLDDTIVIWGGEFGRTAFRQNGKVAESYGRDHPNFIKALG